MEPHRRLPRPSEGHVPAGETFEIQASPDTIKQYLLDAKDTDFSWLSNNCSSFSAGLMRELLVTKPSKLPDLWPTWSRCLATPPVKVPGSGRGRRGAVPRAAWGEVPGVGPSHGPPSRAAGAQEAVGSQTGFMLDAGMDRAIDFPKAFPLYSRTTAVADDDAIRLDCIVESIDPKVDAQEPQELLKFGFYIPEASTYSRTGAERELSRSSSTSTISI
ncbi:unnamed protein product [Prorocentrum cordatum]|uniref:PPPDE domain-containing protein n=1 Tax=Prorocentrum cordatum TaxID=2364126 RepID=A0ABN9T006_9DINO|nr:unnamed protein product [Polarella glacialis]